MQRHHKHYSSPRRDDDPDAELKVLEWKYRDYLQIDRLDELKRYLDAGRELTVRRCEHMFSRFKLYIRLDNGWIVHLKLHQPIEVPFQSISGIRWSNHSSWIIDGRSSDGNPIRCYAWRVVVSFHQNDGWIHPLSEDQ